MIFYHEPITTRYKASGLCAAVLHLICRLTVLIVPFIICFVSGAFWPTQNTFISTPSVNYTGKAVVHAQRASGASNFFITSWLAMEEAEAALEGVPSSMIQRPFYPSVSSAMLDGDGDGKTDVFYFTVQFPIENTESQGVNDAVVKVCIMPEFDYEIYANPRSSSSILARPILFKAAPVICVSNQNSLKVESLYATIKGDLKYYQTKLIEASRYVRYDKPGGSLFNEFPVYALASMSPVAAEYARQNISALFTERFASFDNTNNMMRADEVPASVDTLNMFTFSAELRVLDAVVQYVPAWDEMLKFGWVQYFSVAYVISWIMWIFRCIIAKNGLIDTIAIWEGRGYKMN